MNIPNQMTVGNTNGNYNTESNNNDNNNNNNNIPNHPNKMDGNLDTLDVLSTEILSQQATINIGTLGHVEHGKSTLVEGITGIKPIKFDMERERNITIKLGYANFKVYKCPECPKPDCFKSMKSSSKEAYCTNCGEKMELIRHFSFVDCPGHDCLMPTMLNGAAVMDSAILVVAANVRCPQPQTEEHLIASEIMQLQDMIVVQTKVDLTNYDECMQNYKEIKEFTKGTCCENAPVIPLSCTTVHQFNVDVLLQYLCEKVPVPTRDFKSPPLMQVVRSFDVNKGGDNFEKMKGGIAGGTLLKGVLKLGQFIEIRPGLVKKNPTGEVQCYPIVTYVKSLYSETTSLKFAVPGGLIAVGTTLDPTLTKGDRLVGQVIGAVGHLPDVFLEIEIQCSLVKRVVGVKQDESAGKTIKVKQLEKDETLTLNVGATTTTAKVIAVKGKNAKLKLTKPCCAELEEMVSISRNINGSGRLIGFGIIKHGVPLPLKILKTKDMTDMNLDSKGTEE